MNIELNLANNIIPPSGDESIFKYMRGYVTDSIFSFNTDESDITKIVQEYKQKNLLDIMVLAT